MLYDDGDREWLSFQSERVTWYKDEVAPPKEEPEAMDEDASGDAEVCASLSLLARPHSKYFLR